MIANEYVGATVRIVAGSGKGSFARILRNDESLVYIGGYKREIPRTLWDKILFRTRYEYIEKSVKPNETTIIQCSDGYHEYNPVTNTWNKA